MSYPAELEYVDIIFEGPPGPGERGKRREDLEVATRKLRQANLAGVLAASDHRDAGHCQAVWSEVAAFIDRHRAEKPDTTFVDVVDEHGRGVSVGEWRPLEDGTWALRIEVNSAKVKRGARA